MTNNPLPIFQSEWKKNTWLLFGVIYLLCVFFLALRISTNGLIIGGDSATYTDIAEQILHGNIPKSHIWNPGYSYLLAFCNWLFHGSIIHSASVLHLFLFTLNSILFLLVLKNSGILKPISIFLFSLLFIAFTSYRTESFSMMAELPFITFLLLVLLQLPALVSRISFVRIFVLALTFLCLYFIKPNAIAFVLSFLIFLWLQALTSEIKWKYSAVLSFLFVSGLFAIRTVFGGYDTVHVEVNQKQFFENLITEFGNLGAVFNGFVLNSNLYFHVYGYHYLWSMAYLVLLFFIVYSEFKLCRQLEKRSIPLYCSIAIPVYLVLYIGITSLSYPQVNPRTLLFPNLLLLICMISQAYFRGFHQKIGLVFYAFLFAFFVFGIANKWLYTNATKEPNALNSLQKNRAIAFVRNYLKQHANTIVYCNKPKEVAVFLETDSIKSLPGNPTWHGNEAVFPNNEEFKHQFNRFELEWCEGKNELVLLLDADERFKNWKSPCDSKKVTFEDGIVLIR